MTPEPSDLNPYAAPRTETYSQVRAAGHAELPSWYRRGSLFSVVGYAHFAALLLIDATPWSYLLFLTTANLVVVLCVIALTGPAYFRDRDGTWWKSGWADTIAAVVIGLFHVALIAIYVLRLFEAYR